VSKQQTVISQASQALNLCCSTVEFSGSAEQVEGERLLLVASKRHSFVMSELKKSVSWNSCFSN
jgi:actin-binding protein anillin